MDLIEPRSAISGSTELEFRSSRHLFFLQSKLADELSAWIDTKDDWPVLVSSITRKWLQVGLCDRGITRDLTWCVPVDRPGFEDKVFYVWFDAPIEYIGATKKWAEAHSDRDWRSWWFGAGFGNAPRGNRPGELQDLARRPLALERAPSTGSRRG